jgi:hypothetical protein
MMAFAAYARTREKIAAVNTRTVTLSNGREVTIREMTFAEALKVRDQAETLPITWPLEQQPEVMAALAGIPCSEIVPALAAIPCQLTPNIFAPPGPVSAAASA